ncbi:glycosyltransferase family 2 protein [uncultured Pseudokineococcus sp.]|uniref:glycosyltransferase family 2 protein n=1 Tax=uncultured Pseudokineococcus sp. TaxID=1642928 RepID=UPI002618A560|nr:glycosyltransferase family 2 protein [uncultured Pseudokineococcus sp.]
MRIVATLMVRDEVDVVAAVVEHHLGQGIDALVVTDNGSVDGTAEVLQSYADRGLVELHRDPVHRKQQSEVVTRMARRARTRFAADWVLNIDADEFWVPVDRSLDLRQALERTPLSLNAFTVPVTNLVGSASQPGSWAKRLLYRDQRSAEELLGVGVHAHPTPDAVHRGESDVVVAQGNHFVSLASNGQPDPAVAIEVLHVPWRSWAQVERKVVHAGRAYESNPDLRPSPRHHGMADYRRHAAGRLLHLYALRLPPQESLEEGVARGSFVEDTWLRDHLRALVEEGRAHQPELLAPLLADVPADLEPERHADLVETGALLTALERETADALEQSRETMRLARRLGSERDSARRALEEARSERRELARRLARQEKASPPPVADDVRRVGARVLTGVRRRAGRLRRVVRARARAATGRPSRPRG